MRSPHAAVIALIAAVCSCAGPAKRTTTPDVDAARTLPALTQAGIQDIVSKVSGARALPVKRPVRVELLAPDAFRGELQGRVRAERGTEAEASFDEAYLVGFDFLPPPDRRAGIATMEEVLLEQVAAFYDTKQDAIYVPRVAPTSELDAFIQRAVLAHEAQHALQAQNFALPDPTDLSQDAALARLALIEGDAMVAMGAYIGAELGAPVGRTLRRIRETTAAVPREAIAREADRAAMDRALDLARERLEFPYEAGMAFVSDVYRAGGFPLVDQMYERVPTTTEQILHPAKYLAGEGSATFGKLNTPAGWNVLGSDVLGELQTRVLLQRCKPRDVAERGAAGWGGDRFFALEGGAGRLAMAWVSAWDSEADAAELEATLASATDCFSDNAIGDHRITKAFQVKRRAHVVAFVRGVEPTLQQELLVRLLALPGKPPPAVPLTRLTIPPSVKLPEPEKGTIDGDVYRNEWLGVVGRIPKGMKARLGDELDLLIDRSDAFVAGGLSVSTRVVSDELNDRTFREVEKGFALAIGKHGLAMASLGGGALKTSLGAGIDRTWQVKGTQVQLRTILIPICAGTGAILFTQAYGDAFAKSVLDGWIESFRLTQGRNMKACDYLDPK